MGDNKAKPSGGAGTNTSQIPPKRVKKSSPLANGYLLLYNFTSLALWGTLTIRLCLLLCPVGPSSQISELYNVLFPLLRVTQSLALLEIMHSLSGLVRASVVTTGMQVASRIVVVWGVMHMFSKQAVGAKEGILGGGREAQLGDWGFIGCLSAWGVTECIRYGFFTLQLSGIEAPKWLLWLRYVPQPVSFMDIISYALFLDGMVLIPDCRYNTFFVLYPLGISSECLLMYLAITPASLIHPALPWAFKAILAIYVPGRSLICPNQRTTAKTDDRLVYPVQPHDGAAAQGDESRKARRLSR